MKKILIFVVMLCFSFNLFSQGPDITVNINPNMAVNPIQKTGWNVILSDEFNGTAVNTTNWLPTNVSMWGLPCGAGNETMGANPSNLVISNGTAKLYVTETDYVGCKYSTAEISSINGSNFRSYQIVPNTYIETRVKLPKGHGIGSAGWLWNNYPSDKWHEIDIWETYGTAKNTENCFQSDVHYGTIGANNAHQHQAKSVGIRDQNGNGVGYDSNWFTFGLEWLSDGTIKYYLNNVLYRTENILQLSGYQFSNMFLILGAGKPLKYGEENDNFLSAETFFPKALEIDYVRVYLKNGAKLTNVYTKPNRFCLTQTASGTLAANHFAGTTYAWSSPILNVNPTPTTAWSSNHFNYTYTAPTVGNQYYPVTVIATTSTGYQETVTFQVFIDQASPPLKPTITGSNISACLKQTKLGISNTYVSQTEVLDYGSDNGTGLGYVTPDGPYVSFKVRECNACGCSLWSNTYTNTFPFPGNCPKSFSPPMLTDSTFVVNHVEGNSTGSEPSQYDFFESKSIDIYPNLAEAEVHVQNTLSLSFRGSLFSATGQLIKSFLIQSGDNILRCEDIQPGFYVLVIRNEAQNIVHSEKILKL